jgi:PAS domain-containing protein
MNSQNKLTYVNLSLANMLGYKVSDMIKKDLKHFTDANGERLINEYLKNRVEPMN